jgi:hypothetical protein
MGRLFLSGQTTCALLLAAGLLLRAQAALRTDEPAPQAPRARPAEMFPERQPTRPIQAPRAVKRASEQDGKVPRIGKARSQARKGFAHRLKRGDGGRCGVPLAKSQFKCG